MVSRVYPNAAMNAHTNFRQIQRHHHRQQASPQTTPDSCKQKQPINPRREHLDERARRPHQHRQSPRIEPAQTVIQIQREQGPEGGAQHVEGGDVGLAVGEAGGIVLPMRREEVVVGFEGVEFDTGAVASFVVS